MQWPDPGALGDFDSVNQHTSDGEVFIRMSDSVNHFE